MIIKNILIVFTAFLSLVTAQNEDVISPRERFSLDFDWRFIQEDVCNAELPEFDDTNWRKLDVPHDWSIEGNYEENNPSGKAGAFLPTGIGWYRKHIVIEELHSSNRFFVEFDGVYMNSEVWINGHYLGKRPNGYIGFSYELSQYLKEGDNVLAVRVDHSKSPSGRWYTGSGIYRHVWLTRTSDVYIPQWGTQITTPKVNKNNAKVDFSVKIKNTTEAPQEIILKSSIWDRDDNKVLEIETKKTIAEEGEFNQEAFIENPALWSPDQPNIYILKNQLEINGILKDTYSTVFGVREIEFRGSKGLFLNGENLKFKGLSNHHDAGAVGAAVPNDVLYKRLKMLKDMGVNALRTTHNPFSPEFYAMCDTLGFMVMNEAFDGWWNPKAKYDYGKYFAEWWQRDLNDFIRRDRNHPSVVIWSIGNEVHGFLPEQQKEIVDYLKTIDATRAVTQGEGHSAPYIDIAGFNGNGEFNDVLQNYHKENPDKAIIGTEITHTLQTRGVYRTQTWYRTKDNPAPWETKEDFKRIEPRVTKIKDLSDEEVFTNTNPKYQSSYDNSIVRIGVRDDWNRVEKYEWYIGNFRWSGFDYLGESFGWPARTANFGIIDLAGFPKDHYYLYQSLWSKDPMVHLLPHWTHPGKEGIEIPVVVYTNCDAAELFLNGKSLGSKDMDLKERQLVWKVPYTPGTLTVKASTNGQVLTEKTYKTAGNPAVVQLQPDKTTIIANRRDVVHCEVIISDNYGVMVPSANNFVTLKVEGPAHIIGVENGDILDLSSHKMNYRKAFNGKFLLLLQATDQPGEIIINAESEGLQSGRVVIKAR